MRNPFARLLSYFRRAPEGPRPLPPKALRGGAGERPPSTAWATMDWTADRIMDALIAHDEGQFNEPELLYRALTRDGRIASALEARAEGPRRFDFGLAIEEGTPDAISGWIDQFQQAWPHVTLTETDRSEFIRRNVMFGFSLGRISMVWERDMNVPRIKPWTHYGVSWDEAKRCFRIETYNGKEHYVPLEGNDEWVVFSSGGEEPWLNGALRQLGRLMYMLNQTWDLWQYYNEKLSMALKKLKVPFQVRESAEAANAWALVEQLRSGDTWLEPTNYVLELLESKATGQVHLSYKDLINIVYSTIAIILLRHNLAQETKSGSLAATSGALEAARELSVTDVAVLQPGLRRLCQIWIYYNFTEGAYPGSLCRYAPCPEWDTDEPEDAKEVAGVALTSSQALDTYVGVLQKAGVDLQSVGIDWRAEARKCRIALVPMEGTAPPVKYLPKPDPAALPQAEQRPAA